ncbi:hypothetical protein REPUB_Repub11eG0092500 [Reevesia pubescens]
MDSSFSVSDTILEPHTDLEFESHEAAYSWCKEYAKSVVFGTAKLSSRRSRVSKEFIDAKFTCIRYGNKKQSDDAINPRPSPKIGCKASMHVKKRQDGKWKKTQKIFYAVDLNEEHRLRNVFWLDAKGMEDFSNFGDVSFDITYFTNKHLEYLSLWHDLMLKFDKCIYRSWNEEQFDKRWWKMVDKFHLREMQLIQWVPAFMRDISFAGLSTALRSDNLSSSFDKYVHGETSLRDFIEQYRIILEDRRAIISSEEGSISQESYNLALSSIKEALKQCDTINVLSYPEEKAPDPRMANTIKSSQIVEAALERQINENNATRKRKFRQRSV